MGEAKRRIKVIKQTVSNPIQFKAIEFLGMPVGMWGQIACIIGTIVLAAYIVVHFLSETGVPFSCFLIPVLMIVGGAIFVIAERKSS